jgi:signal transduction histidine kinase/ActR/RegA family two-component response regulator
MLDRTSEGLAGVPFTDLVHPEDTDRVRSAVRELLAGTAESPQLELRLVDAAGEPVWSAVSVALVRDAAGKPLHAVVLLQDQTDTRRAQEEKHALERRLHQSQKLDGLGRLAGGIAHDFNNLLAVILNYANFVADQLPPGGQLYADVEQISEAASRAAALTRQLLAFGRRQVVQTQALDLNAVVTSTEELLRRTIGEDIELRSRLTPDLHLVRADQSQMEQVLVNLAVNGRDAMPTGGVLSITTENVEEAGQVRLTVTDTGTGMSAEVIQHAFEPFFTTKPPAQGTGLGLATVYGIATRDGGDVDIASEPGRGTAVSVVLPVCAAGATGEQEGEQDTAPAARGESVLVVEDEEGVRGLTERILRDAGYRVRTAPGGEEGLTLARELRPDLVLTDVVMPGMSGSSLARAIATELPEIQVVFMCGYTDDVVTRHGVAERRFALLEKPFTRTALLRAVRDALDTGPAGPADV